MANQPKRPPPEYIDKLGALYDVWARKDEKINKFVFADLDIMLDHALEEAYRKECYEAYAHLEHLRQHIKTNFAAKLLKELDYVKKLEP